MFCIENVDNVVCELGKKQFIESYSQIRSFIIVLRVFHIVSASKVREYEKELSLQAH